MSVGILRPNDRYAIIAKSRAGKTALAAVIAGTFARALSPPWEVWISETKHDPADVAMFRKWGARNAASERDLASSALPNFKYFVLEKDGDKSVVDQVQDLCEAAYARKHVLLVLDEYVSSVPSTRSAGESLLNVFQRGGGRNVGLIGLTQEPVYVPRQLISQATHLFIMSLTFNHDIVYVRKLNPAYVPPIKMGDPYGFYYQYIDGGGELVYYPNQ
ncbi:MAG: hypothetical protein ACRDOH_36585, partial [Streptosporangiaceae bacterium]